MKIHLDYHREGLIIEVPDDLLAGVVEAPSESAPEPSVPIVTSALQAPIGTPPLSELARGRDSACVVIPDVTRPMPNRLTLPPVLQELEAAGLARDSVLILIATGLHRSNSEAEVVEMIGSEIAESYRVESHVASDPEGHVRLGVTSTGVPVLVDRRCVQADLKILTGLVEPHLMAGFSGGRKLVCPGLCAEETIREFHSARLLEHPASRNLRLKGNLTHRTSTEAARMVGTDFTLNVVLNSRRELVAAFAGDLEGAFDAAVRTARAVTTVPIEAPADIVIVTGGGYPLDATWYQTIKGLTAALPAVRSGGTIIAAAALREGVGGADFRRLIEETANLEGFMEQICTGGFRRNDQWMLEHFAHVARKAEVLLVSDGLSREEQEKLFVTPVDSVEEGIARAIERKGEKPRILVMPRGPYVLPVPREQGD